MLIRDEQLKVLRDAARQRLRARLFFQFSTRALPIDIALLGTQIDLGLAEAERLQLVAEDDITLFLDTILTHLQCFPVDGVGKVSYSAPLTRFLEALEVPASQRVRRCAEWLTVQGRLYAR